MSRLPYKPNINQLENLLDTEFTDLQNNDYLSYDILTDKWVNKPAVTTGYLSNLTDVNIKDPVKDQVLGFDGEVWTNNYTLNKETRSIKLGLNANNAGVDSISIGTNAGISNQGDNCIAIGFLAGGENQGDYGIAIGRSAGFVNQGEHAIAIGGLAGRTNQGSYNIALGTGAQYENLIDSFGSIAIGLLSGFTDQGTNAIAIGYESGYTDQKEYAVAIGRISGRTNQGKYAVAVGYDSGILNQGQYAVALGGNTGTNNQADYSVCMGILADTIYENTIVINVDRFNPLEATNSGFFVSPSCLRALPSGLGVDTLVFNNITGEIYKSTN